MCPKNPVIHALEFSGYYGLTLGAVELRFRGVSLRLMLLYPNSSGVETRDGHPKIC